MENPLSFLSLYGLDQIITEEDNASLWVSVIKKSWPLPNEAKMEPSKYYFGVGYLNEDSYMKIQPTHAWTFERIHLRQLRVRDCPTARVSDAQLDQQLKAIVPFSLLYCFSSEYWPYGAIVITRPSQQHQKVLIYSGFRATGTTGWGETRIWNMAAPDMWEEGESVGQWIS